MSKYRFLVSSILLTIIAASPAIGDVFRWEDEAGNTHYGSKPPKSAINVQAVGNDSFSRYSSDKMIAAYKLEAKKSAARAKLKNSTAAKVNQKKETPTTKKTAKKPIPQEKATKVVKKKVNKISKKIAPQTKTAKTEAAPPEEAPKPAKLSKMNLKVEHDKDNSVTSCQISLQNSGGLAANSVTVAFKFEDGTLLPASGPDSIDSQKTAIYSVPEQFLPIQIIASHKKLKALDAPDPTEKQKTRVAIKPTPKVIIDHR